MYSAVNRTTRRPPDHHKETQITFNRSGQNHLARHSEKGEEDKADRGRGGETTSGNGQARSLPNFRGQWRTGKNGGNLLQVAPEGQMRDETIQIQI